MNDLRLIQSERVEERGALGYAGHQSPSGKNPPGGGIGLHGNTGTGGEIDLPIAVERLAAHDYFAGGSSGAAVRIGTRVKAEGRRVGERKIQLDIRDARIGRKRERHRRDGTEIRDGA